MREDEKDDSTTIRQYAENNRIDSKGNIYER